MSGIKNYLEIIKADKKVEKQIFYVSVLTALFVLIFVVTSCNNQNSLIFDKSGRLVGIHRNSLEKSEMLSLNLAVVDGDDVDQKEIKLELRSQKEDKKDDDNKDNAAVERQAEIDGLIDDIEKSKNKNIILPTRLSDETRLLWSEKKSNGSKWLMILASYIFLIVLVIKSSVDNSQEEIKQNRKEIMKSLPRFTNQLLLMMNAGMILSDAFEKVSQSYLLMGEADKGYFEKSIIDLYEKNFDNRVSIATLINEFASENSVKELMRISTILSENEKRGSDIIDNLSRESSYLWDERKIVARESGKLIDTKMSYPLGILLILLIVITMAPALLSM